MSVLLHRQTIPALIKICTHINTVPVHLSTNTALKKKQNKKTVATAAQLLRALKVMKLLFFRKPAISISVSCTNRDPLKRSTAGINTRGGKECCESLPVWMVRGGSGGGGSWSTHTEK